MTESEKISQPSIRLDPIRLHKASELFIPSDSTDVLVNSLEGVGVELGNRVAALVV